jgi:hypothetical protein
MRVHRAALLALVALPMAATGCNPKPIGQIVLVVQSDLSIPKDIDTIRIEVFNSGSLKFQQDYDKIGPDQDEIRLPGTISLVASSNPADVITIVVSARSGGAEGAPHVVRKVVTTVPSTKTVMLPLGIHFLCYGQAGLDASGDASSTCADGQTCVGGVCATDSLDSSTFPPYSDAAVNGDGSCFDAARCWTQPAVAAVDLKTCTIPPVSGVNIALQTESLGICGAAGCFVTLDADDPVEGWSVGQDGRVVLPAGVCVQLASKEIINVVTQPVTASCGAKKLSLPTCGPWSAASKNPAAYNGPQALAGGQARPLALALQGGVVYWNNGGIAGGQGDLKLIGLAGGGTPEVVAVMSQAPRSLVVVGSSLLWTDAPGTPGSGTIFRSVRTGGQTDVTAVVSKLDSPEGLTAVPGRLFWTDFQDGAIFTAQSDGSQVARLVAGANYPYRITADGTWVYWTNEGTSGKFPPDGSVCRYQYTAATGVVETLADSQSTPRAIAIDDATEAKAVYFVDFDKSGAIMKVDLTATPPTIVTLASAQSYPNGITVDGGYVYWSNRGDGTVVRLSTTAAPGDSPTVLASGQAAPGTVVLDASSIYWVAEGSSSAETGAILKLPRVP